MKAPVTGFAAAKRPDNKHASLTRRERPGKLRQSIA
jgi:hypothetical protein